MSDAPTSSASRDRPPGPVPQGSPPAEFADAPVVGHSADTRDDLVIEEEPAPLAPEAGADPVADLIAERDEYRDALQRVQADFENFRKRMLRQQTEALERSGEQLVMKLLPVLDAVDLAQQHGGGEGVDQIASALFDALTKEGLERVDPAGEPFDPTEHDAVQHEEGEGGAVVSDVLRAGYRWRGRLLRPAMVKVKG